MMKIEKSWRMGDPLQNASTAARIAEKYDQVHFCYEAGPTGYGVHRLITSLGFNCIVVAPSLIPSKPGDHIKNNRRDAIGLAKLLRADELTAVWVFAAVASHCSHRIYEVPAASG